MNRRKLFSATLCFSIGIVISFVFFEKRMYLFSLIMACLFLAGITIISKYEQIEKSKIKLLFFAFAAGFIVFCNCYFSSVTINENRLGSISNFEATVIKVEIKKDRIVLICKAYKPLNKRVVCNVYNREKIKETKDQYSILGKRIHINGKVFIPDSARNPNCFNYRLYLKAKRISYVCNTRDYDVVGGSSSPYWSFKKNVMQERVSFENCFSSSKETYGFIRGIIFGDKNMLDEGIYNDFIENGTAHILAVSGLHIGFIFAMLRLLTKSRKSVLLTLLIILIMMLYGEMTCWNTSTVRAVLIMVSGLFSFYIRKPFDLLSALSASALTILIYNPYQLFYSGFQMSFLAILGIAFFTKPLQYFLGEYLSMIFAIQLVMIPYTAFMFNRLNLMSIFINIPIVFIASIVVPISMILLLIGIILGTYPEIMVTIIDGLTQFMLEINRFLNFGGITSFRVRSLNIIIVFMIYFILFYIFSEGFQIKALRKDKEVRKKSLIIIIIAAIVIGYPFVTKFSQDELIFIDVGQGDAVYMKANGNDILFDGGGSRTYNVGEKTLLPFMLKNNIYKIDESFLTHLHMDHAKGNRELRKDFPIHMTYISELYRDKAGWIKNLEYLEIGDELLSSKRKLFGGKSTFQIKVLWPLNDEVGAIDLDDNELNMVLMVEYHGHRIMITGDLLEKDELDMLEYYNNTDELRCDVLKIAHHGSKSSTSNQFLDECNPSIAVISVGKNNMYGHPSDITIEKLKKRNIAIYRTDEDGAIGLDLMAGQKIRVDTMVKREEEKAI